MGGDLARRGEGPEVDRGRQDDDRHRAGERPPARPEQAPLHGDEHAQEDEEERQVQVVRRIVPEKTDPAREQDREARRVAAIETAVIVDVRLRERIGARRYRTGQPLEGSPLVVHAAGEQIVSEGQVAELVDRQVPGDLVLEPGCRHQEKQGRRGEPDRTLPGRETPPRGHAGGCTLGTSLFGTSRDGAGTTRPGHAHPYNTEAAGSRFSVFATSPAPVTPSGRRRSGPLPAPRA